MRWPRYRAAQDGRIRVIRQENAGPSRARNLGVDFARGDYVAFLDSDDIWSTSKLESTLAAFNQHPDAGAVFGRIAFFARNPAKPATFSNITAGASELADFVGENPVCTLSNLTVSRAAFLEVGGFDEKMRYSEDLEWLTRAMAGGMMIAATADLHVYYRTSENGLSADLMAMHAGWKRAVESAGDVVSRSQLIAAEATHLRYLARRALRTGAAPRVALGLAVRGLRLAPKTFLGGRHRGTLTLLGCVLSPIVPLALRTRIFA